MEKRDGLLTESEVKNFLTLSGERLLIAQRKHWFALAGTVFLIFFFSLLFIFLTFSIFIFHFFLPPLFILSSFIILTLATTLAAKTIIDWYNHFYIVTNKRILEVSCEPFFSDLIYDVLLDQVRITEIDVKINNIIGEFLDMGDVIVVFDRPSHEEKFILSGIKNPRETSAFLCNSLEVIVHDMPVWFPNRRAGNILKMTEDIFPGRSLNAGG